MKLREKQKQETREKIFHYAVSLFLERKFENVKITDIVEKAGVSVGTFYYHFKSKEAIIDEGYRDFDRELENKWLEESPQEGFDAILFLIYHQIKKTVDMGTEWTSVFFKNQLGIAHDYYFDKNRFLYRKLYENIYLIKQDEHLAKEIMEGILRISRGLIYDWCLHNGNYNVLEVGMNDVVILLAFYGITKV